MPERRGDGRDIVEQNGALEPSLFSAMPGLSLAALSPSVTAMQTDLVKNLMPRIDIASMLPSIGAMHANLVESMMPKLDAAVLMPTSSAMRASILETLVPALDVSAMVPGLTAMQTTLERFLQTIDAPALAPGLTAFQTTLESLMPKLDIGTMVPGFAAMQASLESLMPRFDMSTFAPAFAEMSTRLAELDVEGPLPFDDLVTLVDDVEIHDIARSLEALSDDTETGAVEQWRTGTLTPSKTAAMVCALTVVLSGRFFQALVEHSERPDPATLMMWAFALVTGVVLPGTRGAYALAKKREDGKRDASE